MNRNKISVIVPVYMAENYIDDCLKSLVNQTLSELEIVIVNDGSPDNSEEIIKRYMATNPDKIKYIKIPNGGVANARNIGLDNASGEYIGFCDSDDYVEENMYEILYNKAKETGSEVVVSGYYYRDEEKQRISNRELDFLSEYSKSLEENPNILLVTNPFNVTKIFSKDMLDKSNIRFNKKYRIFEDLLFCYSALLKANKIEKVNKAFYHYFRRKNQSVTGQLSNKFYDLFPVMYDLKEFYEKNSKIDFSEYLTYIAIHHGYLRFSYDVKFKDLRLKYRYIRDTYKFLDEFNPNWTKNIYFDIKKRKNKIFKTKIFWFIRPVLKKIIDVLKQINKIIFKNYGNLLVKYKNKPINEKSFFFESQKGNDINGNMFYIIKAIRENFDYKDYSINIAVTKERINEFKKKINFYNIDNCNLLIRNSKKYIKHLACDKYLFNDTSFPIYFFKRKDQIYLNTWHGTPLKYLGRKEVYDNYNISNVMKNFFMANYLTYPNKFMKDVMMEDYMLDIRNNKVLMLGYPRNSIFFKQAKQNKKQRIAYLPTWRGTLNNNNWGNFYIKELINILDQIDKLLTETQEFYINLHPYFKGKLNVGRYKKINLFPSEYETYDFLNTCDILVTDYSSVFFDFANTKRKIILFPYDKESYLKDRGMYFNVEDLPFTKVYNVHDLIKEINNKEILNYDSFLNDYCNYESEDVPKKILSYIVEEYKNIQEVPKTRELSSILVESNSYVDYFTAKELRNYLKEYKGNKKIYLGFFNDSISENKNYLNDIGNNINYFGYLGFFELISAFDFILLKILSKRREFYKVFKSRFDRIFKNELDRRYGSIDFSNVLLYKEKNIKNIYLYSYMKNNKIIVMDKIPNIDLVILNRYDKIVMKNEKDLDYLKEYISADKLFLIDDFNLDNII